MRREELSLPIFSGITKAAIKASVRGSASPEDSEKAIRHFLFGELESVISRAVGQQPDWASHGKRCVQFTEARRALQFFLRSSSKPQSDGALVLSGPDPGISCLPWAMSGLAASFYLCERDKRVAALARSRLPSAEKLISKKINYLWWSRNETPGYSISIRSGDCFSEPPPEEGYIIIDLDFCNNHLRTQTGIRQVADFVFDTAAKRGPSIFRTTLHVGRVGNAWGTVLNNIEEMDSALKERGFRIREKTESKYASTLPMVSVMWILERKILVEVL